jgi:hypothetical protein
MSADSKRWNATNRSIDALTCAWRVSQQFHDRLDDLSPDRTPFHVARCQALIRALSPR